MFDFVRVIGPPIKEEPRFDIFGAWRLCRWKSW
jgi:hypothetical protein